MNIPLFIVEEHHEAFIAWAYAHQTGALSGACQLLHFDDHSDLGSPVFHTSIHQLTEMPIGKIADFVYEEMRIDNFILPAVYLRLIDDIVWIRQDVNTPLYTTMYVRSFNGDGKKITAGKLPAGVQHPELQLFQYAKIATADFNHFTISKDKNILLDIDLDYFSCIEDPYSSNEVIIEITENEYRDFQQNRYHYLRYLVSAVKAVQQGEQFFYIINHFKDSYQSSREVSAATIKQRIDFFAADLKRKQLEPSLITICKSVHSGFTPAHQADMILELLLAELNELYQTKQQVLPAMHTSDYVPQ